MEVVRLWEKILWWAKFLKNWLKKKTRLAPWTEEGIQNLLVQIGSCGVLWIPSTTNVLPLLGGDNQGGYGVVCKVWIERFNRIPLQGKTLKMDDEWKTHEQQLMEVLGCLCKHLSVIKFLAIHIKTMEAYTCGGLGELFEKCWITTQSTPPLLVIIPYCNNASRIWKGEHNLLPLGKIVWSWHGHS